MIEIIIDNKNLVLKPDTVITYTLVFPNPSSESIPSSVVQWFNIPVCSVNDIIFKHSRHIEVSEKISLYENVIIKMLGVSQRGKMIVKSATVKDYKVSFAFNPFPVDFKDKQITDFDYANYDIGSDTDTIITNAKSYSQQAYPTVDFCFPIIKAEDFYESSVSTGFQGKMNNYMSDNYLKNSSYLSNIQNQNCLVPHFYLLSVLDSIFQNIDFDIEGEFIKHSDFKKLILFNNFALDFVRKEEYYVKADYTSSSAWLSPGWDGYPIDFNVEHDNYNRFTPSPNNYRIAVAGNHQIDLELDLSSYHLDDYNYFSVRIIKNNDIYNLIGGVNWSFYDQSWHTFYQTFNLAFSESDVGSYIQIRIAARHQESGEPDYNGTYCYRNAELKINPTSHNNVNLFEGSIETKNHLPVVSVSNFINNIVKLFSLAVFTDPQKNNIEFAFWKDIINSSQQLDLTESYISESEDIELYKDVYSFTMGLPDDFDKRDIDIYTLSDEIFSPEIPNPDRANMLYYIKNLNKYILSWYDLDDYTMKWKGYKENYENINENISEAKKINIDIKPLKMMFNGVGWFSMSYPETDVSGTSLGLGTGKNEFDFSLLFYHGLRSDSKGDLYPFASTTRYDTNGNALGEHCLRLNGEDGLYEKLAKPYYDYIGSREKVKFKLNPTNWQFHEIHKLFTIGSEVRKIRIKNRNYIPIKIDFQIGMNDKVESCEAELI